MARSFNGLTEWLSVAAAPASAYPLTMACWVNVSNTGGNNCMMQLTFNAGNYFSLEMGTNIGGRINAAVNGANCNSTAGGSNNVWGHACGVYISATSRASYFNGGSKGTSTTNISVTASTSLTIGSNGAHTLLAAMRVAEAAIWNVALTDTEVAALATGISPFRMRPTALVGYWPLWGLHSPEVDMSGTGNELTLTGTAQANHAPVLPFSRRAWLPKFTELETPYGLSINLGLQAVRVIVK